MTPARTSFWSESVYSKAGAVIPRRLRKGNESVKWSIGGVLGELLREPGYCGHVVAPHPPVHVWGIEPCALRDRERALYAAAAKISKPYRRKDGVVLQRCQPASEPILLMAVASWPEPSITPTAERERWERRVIRTARSRWGSRLRGVYAHVDETFYHLHLWVDDDGKPVKRLHAGHGAALELLSCQPRASRKEQCAAYRAGGRKAQDWYHHWVGQAMGWSRSDSPRPRLSRAAAARRRQQELEEREELAARQLAQNRADREALAETDAILLKAAEDARWMAGQLAADKAAWAAEKARQKVELRKVISRVHAIASEIEGQAELEQRLSGLGIDPEVVRAVFR